MRRKWVRDDDGYARAFNENPDSDEKKEDQ